MAVRKFDDIKIEKEKKYIKVKLKNLTISLLSAEKIETTVTRAKELRKFAERMITLGKKNTLASRRNAFAFLRNEEVVAKLFNEIAPKYAERNGGYTRIIKTTVRKGDSAEMAIIELV